MILITLTASALALAMTAGTAYAKVASSDAAKLGKSLTVIGAEKAGNKAGTIPAYNGGLAADAASDPYTNAMSAEALFSLIDKTHLDKSTTNLTTCQLALLAKFDHYKLPIYKQHRNGSAPK